MFVIFRNITIWIYVLLQVSSYTSSCSFSEQCDLNDSELMCNETMSYNKLNYNVTNLKLCNFYNFNINIDKYLKYLPNVRNITIFNSDINFNETFRKENDIEVSDFSINFVCFRFCKFITICKFI